MNARIETLVSVGASQGFDAFVVYGDREHCGQRGLPLGLRPAFRGNAAGRSFRAGCRSSSSATRAGATRSSATARMSVCSTRPSPAGAAARPLALARRNPRRMRHEIRLTHWRDRLEAFCQRGPRLRRNRARPAGLHRRHAAYDRRRGRRGRQRRRPSDEPGETGLRAINEADQLAAFEFAATFTSQGVRNVLHGIEPGMIGLQAARLIGMNGLPQSCIRC